MNGIRLSGTGLRPAVFRCPVSGPAGPDIPMSSGRVPGETDSIHLFGLILKKIILAMRFSILYTEG